MKISEYPMAKFIRLQNGDDIVSEVVEMEDENGIVYMLMNPLKVVYMQSPQNGYLSVSFIPWVFTKICEHQEFIIHADDVLLISNVSVKMNEYYWNNVQTIDKPLEEQHEEVIEPSQEETILDSIEDSMTKRTYH
jgi:hypothetical protein